MGSKSLRGLKIHAFLAAMTRAASDQLVSLF
jgi:hypothetical protein